MIEGLHTLFSFIVAISILVTVHEFGHFWVARLCGVRVLTFSIGFGHALYRRHDKKGTEYIIAAIPMGGYVKMVDEREEPVPEHWLPEAFNRKPVWQRIAIVAAGPIANFVLAFFVLWVLNLGGTAGFAPVIDKVEPNSIAAVAGLEVGQEIMAVDDHLTSTSSEVSRQLIKRLGETGEIKISVKYPDSELQYDSVLDISDWLSDATDPEPVSGLGIELYYPKSSSEVGRVVEGSPAEAAGIQVGDRITRVDNVDIAYWRDMTAYIHARPDQLLQVEVDRDGKKLELALRPELKKLTSGEDVGLIGIESVPIKRQELPEDVLRVQYYGFFGAGWQAALEVADMTELFVVSIKKMVLGQLSLSNIAGPISIAKIADESLRAGLTRFVTILALLSISLGVINLVPIPVLDGGHIMYFLIEWFTGEPVSMKVQEVGFQVGLFMLVALMGLAFYNDFTRHVF